MDKIAVLIPCFNEAKTIAKVIDDYRRALPEATIYVYDNNSTDGTSEIAHTHGAIVRREIRQGKGNVIRTMFRDIEAACYLMIDGDDTYPAEHAQEMCQLVMDGRADMVIGDRLSTTYFEENQRPFHNAGNTLVRHFINALWKPATPIRDVMTGYRAFSPMFVKTFPILAQGFEIETEMTIHALDKNLKIASVGVAYRDRPLGSYSKLNTYTDGAKVLRTIFRLYRDYQPMRFFGAVAACLALASLVLFVPILLEYFATGLVPRFPTLIASGFLMTAALLAVACGLILDTQARTSRKNLEIQMNFIQLLWRGATEIGTSVSPKKGEVL